MPLTIPVLYGTIREERKNVHLTKKRTSCMLVVSFTVVAGYLTSVGLPR
ncbi:MAG: hypothetical protein AAB879_03190 [Patescibacteria group bacterium]